MIRRCFTIVAAWAALMSSADHLVAQVIRGHTEYTVCPTPFRPISGITSHAGKLWYVTYHTFPYQVGFAQYSALPSPAVSDDGKATWTDPGAYVECTNTWYFNPNGSVAFVDFRWHVVDYRGEVTYTGSGACETDGGGDPVYITSYDPYAPVSDEHPGEVSLQGCDGSTGGNSGSGGGRSCWWEWMTVEVSYNGGLTWETLWSGWGQVCEQQAS
jgi:hypothetical protein